MAKVKTQPQTKKKKKLWVQINGPKLFGESKIGETHVYSSSDAKGKTVNQNLMNLTGDVRKQNITVKLMIDDIKENIANTKIISYRMAPSFIKRFVRRRRDKIEFSEVFKTKDNVHMRIKPLVITTSCTRGSTNTAIRKKLKALILTRVSKMTADQVVEEIVSYKLQLYLKNNLKKIHPLRNCEIRAFEVGKKTKAASEKKDDEKVEQKPESKDE